MGKSHSAKRKLLLGALAQGFRKTLSIAATLEATRFRIGRAAGILGISRKTLLEKRKKYGLQ